METLLILLLSACSSSASATFELRAPESGFYETSVRENSASAPPTLLSVSPEIRVDGDELVCQFRVVRHHLEPDIPFALSIDSQADGLAKLVATESLDYEAQNHYSFQIEAISCLGTYSQRRRLIVNVVDENEFAPEWDEESVKAEVAEGREPASIVRVAARDEDGSDLAGKICSYRIETENQPFEVDSEGNVRNTRPLNYSESHSYVLSVSAFDCSMKKSLKPLLVIVEVTQPCKSGWTGLPSNVNYIPGTGPQPLYGEAAFKLCPEDRERCPRKDLKVEAAIDLETRHIGKGCDRDTYNLYSQRRLCGASEAAVDLLAEARKIDARPHDDDDLDDNDRSVTRFDGSFGHDLPEELRFKSDKSFPGDVFTLATWLKHGDAAAASDGDDLEVEEQHKRKEHIFCLADDHKKNRHHTALFVRNCKLVLLLRRESSDDEQNIFKPAEWRWKLPQVCDDQWHHYAVNVQFPKVDLYVDGDKWDESDDGSSKNNNPEVIDDWPLHPVNELSTKPVIGACWQGSDGSYAHALRGSLAGLSYLRGAVENGEVLKCLHQCSESLTVPAATSSMPQGMEMTADGKGSKVVIDGVGDEDSLTKL